MSRYVAGHCAAWLCGVWAMAIPVGSLVAGSPARAQVSPSMGQVFHFNPPAGFKLQSGFTQRSNGYDPGRVAPSIPRYAAAGDSHYGGARYYGGRYYTNQHFTHSHSEENCIGSALG